METEKPSLEQPTDEERPVWERATLKYLGNVEDIFRFPGNGKVSSATHDTGDTPFKPSGQG